MEDLGARREPVMVREKAAPKVRSTLPDPCLLEAGVLPIPELANFAVREGRRPRPIYTGHKWFARRLGSVFRALLVGAASTPDSNFWDLYYGDADLRDIVVLDPFVGGGTSIVEALRLGASAHAMDVDPVACAVSDFEVRAARMPDLSDPMDELKRTVGSKIRRFHMTKSLDGIERVVLHHFWVQVVRCESCGHSFDAHPNFVLGEQRNLRWVICSGCGGIHRRWVGHRQFRCNTCRARTRIAEGNVTFGTARCPQCRTQRPLIETGRSSGKPPQWRLFALEVLEGPNGKRPVPVVKRHFVKAREDDIALFEAAADKLRNRWHRQSEWLPGGAAIARDRTDSRLIDYGYRHWTDLFNARQLLHLSLLAEAIAEYDGATREGLSMAFSSHLVTNCMLASYAAKWRRLTPLFSIRAFRHIQRPVELNPWCDRTGRGTFPNTVRKLMRATHFACNPKEPTSAGGFRQVACRDPAEPPNVVCGTARDLSFLRECTVDLVLTDPPYLDNISYSELSEFFLPWLELLKVVNDPRARSRVSMESLIGQRDDAASVERYADGLCGAFAEIGRVLKTGGLLVFSFRHTSARAWRALAEGLGKSGLTVGSVVPVPGEAGMGLHKHARTGLWDAVFVLRKNGETYPADDFEVSITQMEDVKRRVAQWAENLQGVAIPFAAADELALFRASLVATAIRGEPKGGASAMISLDAALSISPGIRSN